LGGIVEPFHLREGKIMNFRNFSAAATVFFAAMLPAAAMAQNAAQPDATLTQTPSGKQGQAPIAKSDQAQPQGPTGPINTTSGGASASSPQGETPSGMQPAPQSPGIPAPR
jgi:hypothetical protein